MKKIHVVAVIVVMVLLGLNLLKSPTVSSTVSASPVLTSPAPQKTSIYEKFNGELEIVVRRGGTLSKIAQDLGTSWKEVAKKNGIKNPALIKPGQALKAIPFNRNDLKKVSYYGKAYHGRRMANGEIFDMNDPRIVANKWLPFGTIVRLTRIDNGKSIVVVVKDRGPFIKGRSFDVSKAGAQKLGMIKKGVVECKAEILRIISKAS